MRKLTAVCVVCVFYFLISCAPPPAVRVPISNVRLTDQKEAKADFMDAYAKACAPSFTMHEFNIIPYLYRIGGVEFAGVRTTKDQKGIAFLFINRSTYGSAPAAGYQMKYAVLIFNFGKFSNPKLKNMNENTYFANYLHLDNATFCAGWTNEEPFIENNEIKANFVYFPNSPMSANSIEPCRSRILAYDEKYRGAVDNFISVFLSAFPFVGYE